ncbi:hypothetical protein B0H34DRAFT_806087 [Crassisporium funariophilum]|nr:hypothetical protein B0H34DRAFT_680146 [Crassisporium funariophilum]KAF8163777.1 hypothetical protein B0H34DRAFT_806087 [Crassisporium funariophilum]
MISCIPTPLIIFVLASSFLGTAPHSSNLETRPPLFLTPTTKCNKGKLFCCKGLEQGKIGIVAHLLTITINTNTGCDLKVNAWENWLVVKRTIFLSFLQWDLGWEDSADNVSSDYEVINCWVVDSLSQVVLNWSWSYLRRLCLLRFNVNETFGLALAQKIKIMQQALEYISQSWAWVLQMKCLNLDKVLAA